MEKLDNIETIEVGLLSFIIWCAHEKFYDSEPATKKIAKGDLKKKITKKINDYCKSYLINAVEDSSCKQDVITWIQSFSGGVLLERNFEELKNHFSKLHHGPHAEKINIYKIPRVQLEALCIYSCDKTFDELNVNRDKFYLWKDHIRLIRPNLPKAFLPSLQNLFESLEQAISKCNSEKLLIRACQIMFKRETERLCKAFSDGQYFMPEHDYLTELKKLMEDCDAGFGISIPKFNVIWNSKEGDEILLINKQQTESLSDEKGKIIKAPTDWIRIFLMKGEQNNGQYKLSEEETKIIKAQILHKVQVYVILEDAWKHIEGDNLDAFDFAIVKIGKSPVLMGTQFEGSKAEGVFWIDECKPQLYFEETFGSLLIPKNGKVVFEPKLNKNKFTLGEPIGEQGIRKLERELRLIYSR